MNQKNLSVWLKFITICVAAAGIFIYAIIVPYVSKAIISLNGEKLNNWYIAWNIFLAVTAIPCYLMLYNFWRICCEIGKDNSFCESNAVCLKHISHWSLIDVAYFFIGNIVMVVCNINLQVMFIVSVFVCLGGIVIAVAAAALSHLVYKASAIEEQNELTI